ncbi:MAG: hypothetical protein V7785_20335 [Bermanella sp.]
MTLLFELTFLFLAMFEAFYLVKSERSLAEIITYTKKNSIALWGKSYRNRYRLRKDRGFFKSLRNSDNILLIEDAELRKLLIAAQHEFKMQVYGLLIGFIALGAIFWAIDA